MKAIGGLRKLRHRGTAEGGGDLRLQRRSLQPGALAKPAGGAISSLRNRADSEPDGAANGPVRPSLPGSIPRL